MTKQQVKKMSGYDINELLDFFAVTINKNIDYSHVSHHCVKEMDVIRRAYSVLNDELLRREALAAKSVA